MRFSDRRHSRGSHGWMEQKESFIASLVPQPASVLRAAQPIGLILALLTAWEASTVYLEIPDYLLPPPSVILWEMVIKFDLLWPHILVTFYEVIIGFTAALTIGAFLAILIAHSDILRNALYPVLVFLQTTPKMAIAPLFVVWFGFGLLPKVLVAFLICFFPITINMALGLIFVEPEMIRLVRSYRAKTWQVFNKIRFPNSLPYLFAGSKIGSSLAVVGAIVGEFVGSDRGLGYIILLANAELRTQLLFAAIFYLAIMGIALFGALVLLEKIFVPWASLEEIQIHSGGM
jgi:NitT/TauT family transport system permease protein